MKIMIGCPLVGSKLYLSLWAAAMAGICCCGSNGDIKFAGVHDPIAAVQTLLIKHHSGEVTIRGILKGTPGSYVFEGEDDAGNELSTSWNGKKITFETKGKSSVETFPLDFRTIALDLWRVTSEWSDADIRRYNKNNFQDLPENHVSFVHIDHQGFFTVEKKITDQSFPVAEVSYTVGEINNRNPFMAATDITLKNFPEKYEMVVIQMVIDKS